MDVLCLELFLSGFGASTSHSKTNGRIHIGVGLNSCAVEAFGTCCFLFASTQHLKMEKKQQSTLSSSRWLIRVIRDWQKVACESFWCWRKKRPSFQWLFVIEDTSENRCLVKMSQLV